MCLGCVCGQRLDVVVMAPTQKTLHAVAPHLAWIVKAERSLPIRIAAIAWRWRTEIALGLVVFVVWARLAGYVGPLWSLAIEGVFFGALFAIGSTRGFVVRHWWCGVTRHRLRACFVQLKAENRTGRLPFILWVRPTPVGEKATVILRAGQSVDQIAAAANTIAASCWAREFRVEKSRSDVPRGHHPHCSS